MFNIKLRQGRKISCFALTNWIYLRWFVPEKDSEVNWTRTTRGGCCNNLHENSSLSEEKTSFLCLLHINHFSPVSMSVCRTLWNMEHDFSYTELKGNPGCRTGPLEYKFQMSVCSEEEMSTALPAPLRICCYESQIIMHSRQKQKILKYHGFSEKRVLYNWKAHLEASRVQRQRHLDVNVMWLITLKSKNYVMWMLIGYETNDYSEQWRETQQKGN